MIAVVDTGPLYATADDNDDDHDRSLAVFKRTDLEFVIPTFVAAEAAYLVGERLGPLVQARFIRALAAYEVDQPTSDDWPKIAQLIEGYADFPLGAVDASVAVLADRLGTDLIITLDQRHFRALRTPTGGSYLLLPE